MPPRIKTTKEAIIMAAIDIIRANGPQTLNARNIAAFLGCSTQPIFSNFTNMEDLQDSVTDKAEAIYTAYMAEEVAKGIYPAYKASGMAYIQFAKEERELFKYLFMRPRSKTESEVKSSLFDQMVTVVQDTTGLTDEKSKLFHLEMWAYVHGIAVMFATEFLNLEWDLVSQMLTDAYQGGRKQFKME